MRSVEEVLALYQPEPLTIELCPLHEELLQRKNYTFASTEYEVKAAVDHVSPEFREIPRGTKRPAGAVFVLYVADLHALDPLAPGPMMTGPLAGIISNAYNWHALCLNAAALLSKKQVQRLHLQQMAWGNPIHFPRYNRELVTAWLSHYATYAQEHLPLPAAEAAPVQPLSQNTLFT